MTRVEHTWNLLRRCVFILWSCIICSTTEPWSVRCIALLGITYRFYFSWNDRCPFQTLSRREFKPTKEDLSISISMLDRCCFHELGIPEIPTCPAVEYLSDNFTHLQKLLTFSKDSTDRFSLSSTSWRPPWPQNSAAICSVVILVHRSLTSLP